MAGSHAGQSFNTYPLMNGKFIPDDIYLKELGILNLFENTVTINFNHRWIATLTFIYTFSLFTYLFIKNLFSYLNNYFFVLFTLSLQFFLGVMALVSNVAIQYASLHQTNSVLLLSILLFAYFKSKLKKGKYEQKNTYFWRDRCNWFFYCKKNEEGYSPVIISRNKEDLISKAKNIDCEYETCDVLNSDQIEKVSKNITMK